MADVSPASRTGIVSTALLPEEQAWLGLPSALTASVQHQLMGLLRNPQALGNEEWIELVDGLREAVALAPAVPELRVLLAMVRCIRPHADGAKSELREAVRAFPSSFAARLSLGELMMRLRLCDEAAEQTRIAAERATNAGQSELARRQAVAIRTMLRNETPRTRSIKFPAIFSRVRRSSISG